VDGIAVQHERDALIAELDALPDTVIRLLRDSELQHRLARGGRALVETHYTWARTADMYEELYQAVSDQVQC
jgi:glycosyltransferase involved in cell wall biosynthesis